MRGDHEFGAGKNIAMKRRTDQVVSFLFGLGLARWAPAASG